MGFVAAGSSACTRYDLPGRLLPSPMVRLHCRTGLTTATFFTHAANTFVVRRQWLCLSGAILLGDQLNDLWGAISPRRRYDERGLEGPRQGRSESGGTSARMGSIGRYIFRTTLGAFLVVLISVTTLVWLTQASR